MAAERPNKDHEETERHSDDLSQYQMRNEPPQLGASIRNHTRGCECGQNIGEGGDGGGDSHHFDLSFAALDHEANDDDSVSTADGEWAVDGDEGIPQPSLRIGQPWMDAIFHPLARLGDFTWRIGVLPEVFDSHFPSGVHTPNSMYPEHDSAESSMVSSLVLSPPFMRSSTILASVGEGLAFYHFTADPLTLVPACHFPGCHHPDPNELFTDHAFPVDTAEACF